MDDGCVAAVPRVDELQDCPRIWPRRGRDRCRRMDMEKNRHAAGASFDPPVHRAVKRRGRGHQYVLFRQQGGNDQKPRMGAKQDPVSGVLDRLQLIEREPHWHECHLWVVADLAKPGTVGSGRVLHGNPQHRRGDVAVDPGAAVSGPKGLSCQRLDAIGVHAIDRITTLVVRARGERKRDGNRRAHCYQPPNSHGPHSESTRRRTCSSHPSFRRRRYLAGGTTDLACGRSAASCHRRDRRRRHAWVARSTLHRTPGRTGAPARTRLRRPSQGWRPARA